MSPLMGQDHTSDVVGRRAGVIDELAVLHDRVALEGGSWVRDVYGHVEALLRPLHRARSGLRVHAELRYDGGRVNVTLREQPGRGSAVVALLAQSDPPKLEPRTFVGRSRSIVEFHFGVVPGRLSAGVTHPLDPAGVAERALLALLEALRVDGAPMMAPREAAEAVETAVQTLTRRRTR